MSDSRAYLSNLHKLLDRYFNLEEIRTLCFDLSVDYDSVKGEGKSNRIRELILALGRNGRLPELVNLARQERPHVAWPPVPADFELPAPLASDNPASNVYHYYGDMIQGGGIKVSGDVSGAIISGDGNSVTQIGGDQVQGDKVGGDKIDVGDISHSSGIAIGRDAAASVQTTPQSGAVPLKLLMQLTTLLSSAPPQKTAVANELAEAIEAYVSTAHTSPALRNMLRLGIQQAAQSLEDDVPGVVALTDAVLTAVG